MYAMDLCMKLSEAAGGDGKVCSIFDMRGESPPLGFSHEG